MLRQSRVLAVAVAAAVALILGFQLGRWTAPPTAGAAASGVPSHTHGAQPAPGPEIGGLSLSAGGYRLVPERTAFAAGSPGTFRFRVRAADGAAVTSYVTVHDRPLHLVVVRRDLGGFQHLHPSLGADGVWSTPLTLGTAGAWRAVADFSVMDANRGQVALALGVDLTVAGSFAPAVLPAATRESSVDGYTVVYEGTARPAATAPLTFRVFRDGSPVSLEQYLGSLGHLVVLRQGDVGYVHVHADPPASNSSIRFWLTPPGPGHYRMYFEFSFAGTVHTAAFTLEVT